MMFSNLEKVYDNQYLSENEEWRRIGAKTKAKNILDIFPQESNGIKVLDLGSGDGSVLKLLSENNAFSSFSIYSLEISESGIDKIKNKNINNLKEILKFDGYKIPYDDLYFDIILCSHVIEHVENPRILLREIKRVAKSHIFEIPIDFSFSCDKKVNHFLSYGHINIFTPQLFNFLLLSEGFIVKKELHRLYSNQTYNMIYRNKPLGRLLRYLRAFVWSVTPYLMIIKPDTYTVFTKNGNRGLEIFKNI
jgi:ubiquinone/menaquinone biosynthesis C-methylase UbiE